MYPKTSFKGTINRVEKLCHSKRMQVRRRVPCRVMFADLNMPKVRLSVWRDEFKGVENDEKVAGDSDVIDLTEPTLVGIEDDGGDKEDPQSKSDQASSRPPSLPPASSEVEDEDFDIEAVIRTEEERLSTLRGMTVDSGTPPRSLSPTLPPDIPSSKSGPGASAMDVDEESLWGAVDDPQMFLDPPESNPPSSAPPDDDEMWDIVDQIEQGGQSKPAAKAQIPISGVNPIPSMDSTHSGNTSRATNDDDWDEMYS